MRLLWISALIVAVGISGALGAASAAGAPASLGSRSSPPRWEEIEAAEAEAEETEEEEEEEEEEIEVELEEVKAGEGGREAARSVAPAACLIHTTRAEVLTYPARDRLQMLIHYTSSSPTAVIVNSRVEGKGGPLGFAAAHGHLARRGLYRLAENLDQAEMAKVEGARTLTVDFRVPQTPPYCEGFLTRHLRVQPAHRRRIADLATGSIASSLP
jgi:hypothetical protein